MRPASAKRTRTPAAGPSAARVRARRRTHEPPRLISSARSAPSTEREQPSSCPDAIRRMNLPVAKIAAQIAPGAHAALLVYQAGWHLSGRLVMPLNITLIPLPAKCPELNPQENVWQFLRDNSLSNRIFKSYDVVVDHCCEAWNNPLHQPRGIMSIGLRNWAHRS